MFDLRAAEVDTHQGDVEPAAQSPQQLAVAAADLEDGARAIGRQPLGHPLRAERAGPLSLLFAEIIVPASQGPVESGVGVKPAPFPGRPPAQGAAEHLVPGIAGTAGPKGIPRPDRKRLGRNRQVHVNHPWSGRHRCGAGAGRLVRAHHAHEEARRPGALEPAASLGEECTNRSRDGQGGPDRRRANEQASVEPLARPEAGRSSCHGSPGSPELNVVCLAFGGNL